MAWYFCPHTMAWWLVQSKGVALVKLYGPFDEQEAALAGGVHRTPFQGVAA